MRTAAAGAAHPQQDYNGSDGFAIEGFEVNLCMLPDPYAATKMSGSRAIINFDNK